MTPTPSRDALQVELDALRAERASHLADVRSVLAWLRDPRRKPAFQAFTEGPERMLAYEFEKLQRGESICPRCGLRDSQPMPNPPF